MKLRSYLRELGTRAGRAEDGLWLLPLVWLGTTYFLSLKICAVVLAVLFVRMMTRWPEKRMKASLIPFYEIFVTVALTVSAVLVTKTYVTGLTGVSACVLAVSVMAGIGPLGETAPEKTKDMVLGFLGEALRLFLFAVLFGLSRELLAQSTLCEGTRFLVHLDEKLFLKPIPFFATVPGGFVLAAALLSAFLAVLHAILKPGKIPEETAEPMEGAETASEETAEEVKTEDD